MEGEKVGDEEQVIMSLEPESILRLILIILLIAGLFYHPLLDYAIVVSVLLIYYRLRGNK